MATRRTAREWTVQLLFQLNLNPMELDKAFAYFWEDRESDPESKAFVEEQIRAIGAHRDEIDAIITAAAANWDLARMGVVERNVLRMATAEMLYRTDVPPVVSINEAVDVAKYFGSTESGRFVNGILDRIRKDWVVT